MIVSVHNIQGNSGFMRKMATFDVNHSYEGGTLLLAFLTLIDVVDDAASVCCFPNMKYGDFMFSVSMRFSGLLYLFYFSEDKITLLKTIDLNPVDIELLWCGYQNNNVWCLSEDNTLRKIHLSIENN